MPATGYAPPPMAASAVEGTVRRPCPVCGTADAAELFAESAIDPALLNDTSFASRKRPEYMHHRLERCRRCEVLFANPAPPAEALLAAYQTAGYDSSEEAKAAAATYGELLDGLLSGGAPRDALLDIGAGDGAFLEQARARGFRRLVGFEPSEEPVHAAPPQTRALLRQEGFTAGAVDPGTFSVVTCFQTIEHVPDPLGLCCAARDALAAGGQMMLICHDWRAAVNRALGRRSPIFDIEHLQLLSRPAGEALLRHAGFEDVRVHAFSNRYPLRYWVRLMPLPAAAKDRALERLSRGRLGALRLRLPVGNILVTGVRAG